MVKDEKPNHVLFGSLIIFRNSLFTLAFRVQVQPYRFHLPHPNGRNAFACIGLKAAVEAFQSNSYYSRTSCATGCHRWSINRCRHFLFIYPFAIQFCRIVCVIPGHTPPYECPCVCKIQKIVNDLYRRRNIRHFLFSCGAAFFPNEYSHNDFSQFPCDWNSKIH